MLPTIFSAKIGLGYSSKVSTLHKKAMGQFFTPTEIAHFMAERITISKSEIKVLDPGFGIGILTCALAEVLSEKGNVKSIVLDAYENDLNIIKYSEQVLEYLRKWLEEKGISFTYKLYTDDFIINNSDKLSYQDILFTDNGSKQYDVVISNPPYFKLSFDDKRAKIAKDIINGQPNIYAIFMYLSVKLLRNEGEFVFIVPRSFVSGQYFKLFRERFLELSKMEWIHLFESRKKQFDNDDVLQENVIIKGKRITKPVEDDMIIISSSQNSKDLNTYSKKEYRVSEILDIKSSQKILHIPTNDEEIEIIRTFKKWTGNLNKYNLQISTGPVVTFRATKFLSSIKKDESYVPLYDLYNVRRMVFEHPINKNGKAQFIQVCEETKSLLIKNKNYVFLRRFSTKDDKKRLIASPYFMDITNDEFIGVENHLNYIYKPNGLLNRNEVLGISALLNSELFDRYFRIFNGNINVSATELRAMHLPPLELIKEIGNKLILENNFMESKIDEILIDVLKLEKQYESVYEEN